ncbi:MAG: energy transducer TonB [Proteobacteria bacterium]|nr:energy transducer TonB [Pseudomonadota bacterium]
MSAYLHETWEGMDRQSRLLTWCVGVSLLLHALLLSFHFRFPDALKFSSTQPLEVILVNAKTKEKPSKAQALAQANLDGGGNTDQNRRAKTPLPVTKASEGRDLAEAKRRVTELEAQQQRLLALAKATPPVAASEAPRQAPAEVPAPQPSGRDLRDLALAAMKLQAQIDRRHEEYQKRPRKQFIGANASEYRFAQYEEEWRNKVERVGTLNYPAEARGKIYGNLRLEVTIRPDGSVDSVRLERSSGLKVLDDAAFRIVRMAAPYGEFPPDIRKDTDLLIITRTWFFGQGDAVWTKRD